MIIVKQRAWSTDFPYDPSPEFRVEFAARTCYQSDNYMLIDDQKSHEAFVRKLIKRGHESMLEHVSATFTFITSRAIANEIVRHRLASYAQESTRYVDYKGDIEFVLPTGISEQEMCIFKTNCIEAEHDYKNLRKLGVAPQIARDVLPLCLKTELVMTANFREWRHFLKLRTAPDAHPMIRELAGMVLDEFRGRAPVFVEDIQSAVDARCTD